jgi:hypothetical protein
MALLPVMLALAWVAVVTVFVSAGVAAARADRGDAASDLDDSVRGPALRFLSERRAPSAEGRHTGSPV